MSASASMPLRLLQRSDLEFQRQCYQGRDYWVVKDPLSLKYYRFEEEEFALLKMIDGIASPQQIKRQFDFRFAPQKITLQELYQFAGMLYRSSLLISDAPGQGLQLRKRGDENRKRERTQSLTNILAIRYRGFNPDRILDAMNAWLGWFFSLPALLFAILLGIAAAGLIIAQFDTFSAKLPSFQEFFAARNWIWLAMAMAVTKVLHEFGHGLACKRFGGQCHEMGVMLLVLTPCLYANVSDSWLLKSKWKRAAIAAAGMYVELVIASLAVFVWWFSHPGMINQLALNTVFVCSVSTLLFNANPLLRYDGYYILSDLLEIPNLRTKATSVLQRACGSLFLGMEHRHDPFLPARHRWLFAFYSVAAALYRWVITFSIFWFVYRILEPYGFKIVGQMIALTAIYGLIGMPLIKLCRFFSVPGRIAVIKPVRATVSVGLVSVILLTIMVIPLPHYTYCHLYVQPADAKNIYVDVPGSLAEIYVTHGGYLEQGQPIIRLHSQDLLVQLASLETDARQAGIRLENMKSAANRGGNPDGLNAAQVSFKASRATFNRRVADHDRLTISAPIAGYFLMPPRQPPSDRDPKTLERWSGSPLDPKNLECYLQQSTLLGQIAPDLNRLEAVLAVDQQDIEWIVEGQPVEILIDQLPCQTFQTEVAMVTPTELKQTPKALSSRYGGAIVTRSNEQGEESPVSTKYLVKAVLQNSGQPIVAGSTGQAKIRTGSKTIAQRCWRMLQHTFQFEL